MFVIFAKVQIKRDGDEQYAGRKHLLSIDEKAYPTTLAFYRKFSVIRVIDECYKKVQSRVALALSVVQGLEFE